MSPQLAGRCCSPRDIPAAGWTQRRGPGCRSACGVCRSSAISWHAVGRALTAPGHPGCCCGPLPCHGIPRRGRGCGGSPMVSGAAEAERCAGAAGAGAARGPGTPTVTAPDTDHPPPRLSASRLCLLGCHQDVPLFPPARPFATAPCQPAQGVGHAARAVATGTRRPRWRLTPGTEPQRWMGWLCQGCRGLARGAKTPRSCARPARFCAERQAGPAPPAGSSGGGLGLLCSNAETSSPSRLGVPSGEASAAPAAATAPAPGRGGTSLPAAHGASRRGRGRGRRGAERPLARGGGAGPAGRRRGRQRARGDRGASPPTPPPAAAAEPRGPPRLAGGTLRVSGNLCEGMCQGVLFLKTAS